jgi:hypothetical protein
MELRRALIGFPLIADIYGNFIACFSQIHQSSKPASEPAREMRDFQSTVSVDLARKRNSNQILAP